MPLQRLLVVTEVSVGGDPLLSRNRSFNEIVAEYTKHFDEVHLIAPSDKRLERATGWVPNLYVSTIDTYAKPVRSRLKYFVNLRGNQARLRDLVKEINPTLVQLRVPSLFSMSVHKVVSELQLPVTTYIAGDWGATFANNYKFPGSKLLGYLLDQWQRPVLAQSVMVSAGPALAEKYKVLGPCYPYYSTTHREVFSNFAENRASLLYVGRLEPLKRVEDAIYAVDLLRKRKPYVRLHVVGDGVERARLEALVAERRLTSHVIFEGQVRDEGDLRRLYQNAAVLVFPSLAEGTPKVVTEAMAHGVIPIAVKDVGSIPHIVKDGSRGFLVDAKSPQQIAARVCELCESDELFARMQAGGYEYAKAHTLTEEVRKLWAYVQDRVRGTE